VISGSTHQRHSAGNNSIRRKIPQRQQFCHLAEGNEEKQGGSYNTKRVKCTPPPKGLDCKCPGEKKRGKLGQGDIRKPRPDHPRNSHAVPGIRDFDAPKEKGPSCERRKGEKRGGGIEGKKIPSRRDRGWQTCRGPKCKG